MKMMRYIYVIVLLFNILLNATYSFASEDKKKLIIAYTKAIPPYIYQSNEVSTGILAHSLQSILGKDFSIVLEYKEKDSLQKAGAIQAFIGTKPVAEGLPFVKAFTLSTIPLSLLYTTNIRSLEDVGSRAVGYIDFGIPPEVLKGYYPFLDLVIFPSIEQLTIALKNKEVSFAILPRASMSSLSGTAFQILENPVAYIGINLYIHKDDTALLNTITSTFVQRLVNEQSIQSSPISYIVVIIFFLLLPLILVVFFKRKATPMPDSILNTTIELSKEVFLDYFLCTMTQSGVITSVSKGITQILGYEPQVVVGSTIKKLQHDPVRFTLPPKDEMQHISLNHINGSVVPLAFFSIKTIAVTKAETQYEFIAFNIAQLIERQELAFSILSLYQTIFSKSPVGIARYSIEQEHFIHMNPVFEKMVNTTKEQEQSLVAIFGTYANDIIEKTKHGLIHNTVSIEHDQEQKWFMLYANAVEIIRKSYIDIFLIDVTLWHKAKQQTEEAYTYLRRIIDILPDPTFILDNDKKVIAWNKALEELTGVSAKVMLGKDDGSYSIPFHGSIHTMLCDSFYENNAVQEGQEVHNDTITAEVFCPALGGKYLWVATSVLRNSSGLPMAVIQTMQDITESKENMLALEKSKERYIMVLEAANEGIWEVDLTTKTVDASPKCYEILGIRPEEQLSYSTIENLLDAVYPEYREDICSRMKLILEGKIEKTEFIFRIMASDSTLKWIQSAVFVNKGHNASVVGIVGSLTDITQRKEHENITRIIFLISNAVNIAREPKELFQAIHTILTRYVGYNNLIVALWNEKENCMEYPYYYDERTNKEEYTANATTRETAPRPIADVFSSGTQLVVTEHDGSDEHVWLATPLRVLDSIIGVIATHKNTIGSHSIEAIYSKNDKELMIAIGEQIGIAIERYNSKEQLTAMALHDPLTGLPNRVLFSDRLDHAIRRVNRSADYRFAVFMLDLDRFKLINDTYGHNTGDLLLIEVANRIQPLLRSEDTFARLGGDEFAIILENIHSTHEVLAVANRILRAIEKPLIIEGKELKTATSIGIVLDASSYDSAHTLLRDADIAMYDAKTNGKGRFRVFDQAMHQQMLEYVSLESDLNNTIDNNELFLEYQPVVDAHTTALVGFEALVRWQHPEKGIIYPNRFINIAEENGFIIKLGTWVLEEACRVMKKWVDNQPLASSLSIAVNLSAKQAVQGGLTMTIMDIIESTGIVPSQVNLEVTETTIMKDPKNAKASFEELRGRGVQIAIDDFGSGYSSMTYLQRFPVDILKIDRAFIQNASSESGGIEIIRAICALAHGLGMRVIAEGVENQEQLSIVQECKCDYIQGFLFSKPLSEERAFEFLQNKAHNGAIKK